MTPRPPSRKRLRSLCAEVHPDDGADPRVSSRKGDSRKKPGHKALQLCRQVAEALDALLADAAPLRDLAVVEVTPAPDASRLLATLAVRTPDGPVDPAPILASLGRASGRLRAGVAASITRKRAPLLAFRLVQLLPGGPGYQ